MFDVAAVRISELAMIRLCRKPRSDRRY